jgi:ATP-binding cassette subfamily B protein
MWGYLEKGRKLEFSLLLLLMLLASVAEVLSIGAIVPFLGVLTSPDKFFSIPFAIPYINMLGVASPEDLLLPLALSFALATFFAGIFRYWLLVKTTSFSYGVGADFSNLIYRRTLYQPYHVHITRNSSEVINGILSQTGSVIHGAFMPALMFLSATLMIVAILIPLFAIDAVATGLAFGGFSLIYLVIILTTRKKLLKNSHTISTKSSLVVKSLSEGLGGIRDILLDSSQEVYVKTYKNADEAWRAAQASSVIIGASPRYGVEVLGMLLITFIAYFLAQDSNTTVTTIPVLGALALGAQRLLPTLQQAYASWSSIVGAQAAIKDVLYLLDRPVLLKRLPLNEKTLPFLDQIDLKDIWFRYAPDLPWVFSGLQLSIKKGDRIGFIGVTGCGKSTLLDLIMGLLPPSKGVIEIDGEVVSLSNVAAWQGNISHVPQTIFLSDATIAENIAFGIPFHEIDLERVKRAAQQAQISTVIELMKLQYLTIIGERGIKLSGGQRQRIGIARALYKEANVLILDEATSALDTETEQAVVEAIENLSPDLTILVIAHRISTLKSCSQIIELNHGAIGLVKTENG